MRDRRWSRCWYTKMNEFRVQHIWWNLLGIFFCMECVEFWEFHPKFIPRLLFPHSYILAHHIVLFVQFSGWTAQQVSDFIALYYLWWFHNVLSVFSLLVVDKRWKKNFTMLRSCNRACCTFLYSVIENEQSLDCIQPPSTRNRDQINLLFLHTKKALQFRLSIFRLFLCWKKNDWKMSKCQNRSDVGEEGIPDSKGIHFLFFIYSSSSQVKWTFLWHLIWFQNSGVEWSIRVYENKF